MLWRETPQFRRHRRRHFAFLAPVAALAGGLWGAALGGPGAVAAGAGIFAGCAYLHTRIHPVAVQWAQARWGRGGFAALLWDLLVVSGGGLVLTRGVGLAWPPAVATALVLGGSAALGLAWFLGDGGSRALHALVSPLGRHGPPQALYSPIEARLARGEYGAARDELAWLVAEHPREVRGWVSLARLLAGPLTEPEEGIRVLEDGLQAVRGDPIREAGLLREVVALREATDQALKAAPLVARYAHRWPPGPDREWARETLGRIRSHLEGSGRG
jgi:hypothetical protein